MVKPYKPYKIKDEGFYVKHHVKTISDGDTPYAIVKSFSKTVASFSSFWNKNKFDLVFALGDRFEMFASVFAGSPFNVKFAHIAAGETTLGAIANAIL